MPNVALQCTALHCTALYRTALHCTVLQLSKRSTVNCIFLRDPLNGISTFESRRKQPRIEEDNSKEDEEEEDEGKEEEEDFAVDVEAGEEEVTTSVPRQDCVWSQFGDWSQCSLSCGRGRQIRYRQLTGTTFCSEVQCGAVQCGAVQCIALHCSAVQCGAMQCGAVQCGAVQCSAVQCSALRCSAVQVEESDPESQWRGEEVQGREQGEEEL